MRKASFFARLFQSVSEYKLCLYGECGHPSFVQIQVVAEVPNHERFVTRCKLHPLDCLAENPFVLNSIGGDSTELGRLYIHTTKLGRFGEDETYLTDTRIDRSGFPKTVAHKGKHADFRRRRLREQNDKVRLNPTSYVVPAFRQPSGTRLTEVSRLR